jgi:hypothetical protein
MSTANPSVIACSGCQRQFAWKPLLAGKKVKCKCGTTIAVPAAAVSSASAAKPVVPAPKKPVTTKAADPDDLDGLFALADDAERAAAAAPIEVREVPIPVAPVKSAKKSGAAAIALGYQRGPTALERQKAMSAAAALVDPVRDWYAPSAILGAGFLLYLSYYAVRFHLGSGAIVPVGFGVLILTVFKAVMLVGIALLLATPLGVSFGGLWSAILKLAAIAVFTDGVTAWVDLGVVKISGGFGGGAIFGWGVIGYPVAIGLYWGLMIYLFSMDPADSWFVVVCLSVADRILRTVLLLVLLDVILGWGGVAIPASPAMGGRHATHSASVHASELSTHVDELKDADALVEAKQYIADGHQAILDKPVQDWYVNGCTNVWFSMSGRDINGKRSATGVIIELPDGHDQRAKCYDILKQYYKDAQIPADPSEFTDTGETYLQVEMR